MATAAAPRSWRQRWDAAMRQLPHLPRALGLIRGAAGGHLYLWIIVLVAQGLLPAATVSLVPRVVDGLVAVLADGAGGWLALRPLTLPLVGLASLVVVGELLGMVSKWLRTVLGETIGDHISELIQQRACSIDYAFYEQPEYYDQMHRARWQTRHRPVALLEQAGGLLQHSLTLLAMVAILLPYGIWVPLALLLSILPTLWVVVSYTLRQYRWSYGVADQERLALYYDWLMSSPEGAGELRLFDLGEHFQRLYGQLRTTLREQRLGFARRECLAEIGALLFALLALGGGLLWMLGRLLRGQISLGDLALFYQALNLSQRGLRSLFTHLGEMYRTLLTLGDLFAYLDLDPQVTAPEDVLAVPTRVEQSITFRGVSFSYPESSRKALEDFDLEIPAGKTVAILGANGAGKSTLIKLLCRFYDPDAGSVEIDGIDLRRFDPSELRRRLTVLFQQPVQYSATVRENVALGDLSEDRTPLDLATGEGRSEIETAAQQAGADTVIASLDDGYETILGKWFPEGTELSGGEWQRLALARAFYRRAPIMLLDEPTSAMDAWSEADWLGRFKKLAQGRVAIFITHRFTTAVQADVIHVMDGGRIAESGSHEELLARGGPYATAWQQQMGNEPPGNPSSP